MAVQSWLNGILNVSPEGLLLTEDEYKLAKEDFVKDKDGTDHMEVLSVLLPFAVSKVRITPQGLHLLSSVHPSSRPFFWLSSTTLAGKLHC